MYEEDQDLIEDVLVEIRQAIDMSSIYLNILSGTMDAFSSIISNNLNIVMKVLASLTLLSSIPTVVSGIYGMNVDHLPVPFFWFPITLSIVCMVVAFITSKRKICFNSKSCKALFLYDYLKLGEFMERYKNNYPFRNLG